MNSLRTRAIVLRRTNYGEADRILQLLTPDGKRSVMARGVRREKSRLAGGIELFAVSDVVIGQGKGELGILTSARLIQFYSHIMEDYDRMQFAYSVIKFVSQASETVDEPEWYDVLHEVLMGLDVHSIPLEMIQAWFYLHYAALLGHELSLWHDSAGEKLSAEQNYRYDEAEQGLRQLAGGELGSEHIKLLRLLATRPLKTLAQIGGIESILADCLSVARQHAAV
ncbi:DNA repair protein RecO [Candidatus Saccharibacteria bacterium]|nr:DNA repair protein RecO [Candidatus Saccharibacteria bacterium]